ncbi:MAG: hypothetical protein JW982_00490 [Spirochaetes bacterium]|nr:hypothetical protein [Spirochaetota bacterium]
MFIIFLIIFISSLDYFNIKDEYLIMAAFVAFFGLLPILDIYNTFVEKFTISDSNTEEYINSIDDLLNINSLDDFVTNKFYQILKLVAADHGILAIYDQDSETFSIFSHVIGKNSVPIDNRINFSKQSIIYEITKSRDDIIIKSKLSHDVNINKKIIAEMNRLKAEIMIPIYYLDIFAGVLFLGGRKTRFSGDDIFNLKIFAAKIASISINSFFWREMIRKNELDKERKLGKKVQKNFLPQKAVNYRNIETAVKYSMPKAIADRFYGIFPDKNHVNITTYGAAEEESSSLIFLPSIKAMLETYSRRGYSAEESIRKMMQHNTKHEFIEEKINMLHSYVYTNGRIEIVKQDYPDPFLFNKGSLVQIKSRDFMLQPSEILIFCNVNIEKYILSFPEVITGILSISKNLERAADLIIHAVKKSEEISKYKFFTLIRVNADEK